jgi:isocitrate dehydrogenase kinase/phosphatase
MNDPHAIARTILDGFDRHYRLFRETSARAKERWEHADWQGVREASRARIDMYDARVLEGVEALRAHVRSATVDEALWPAIKRAYIGLLHEHMQPECAETFFNSIAARMLDRRYYKNAFIFKRPAISTEHLDGEEPTYRCYYPDSDDLSGILREAILAFDFQLPFADLERDIALANQTARSAAPPHFERKPNFQVHVLRSAFFRNKGAYVIGRVLNGSAVTPFVVSLLQDEEHRIYVDALLLDPIDIGRVFSLGRAYFFVDMEVPSAYVAFLQTVAPTKPRAELYTMIGLQKQGKTMFYRDFEQHLRHSTDPFVLAEGTKGMVMLVFTLPSYPYVFKVIRDWFVPPKDTDRASVKERYRFVKLRDRVGRMSDSLEYRHVAFPKRRFSPELLEELEKLAPSLLAHDREQLVIEHLYIERRLVPLDVYLQKTDDRDKQRNAIDEYGRALKDLAAANIFAGDLLLKNFGLTRFGRVVFYDYDEICELTDCRFRTLPRPQTDADEMASEPFFTVEDGDVFPEQFPTFLFPPGELRDIFLELHGDLATAAYWRAQQERIRDGVQGDVFPYPEHLRFRNRSAAVDR